MSQMYDRTVAVSRSTGVQGEGAVSYGGKTASAESPVVSGIKASIQSRNAGKSNPTGLPGDIPVAQWQIFINRDQNIAPGVIKIHDIVRDDLGRKFEVTSDYCNFMGWRLTADRLEA